MSADALPEVIAIERSIYPFPWTMGNFRDSLAAGYDCLEYRSWEILIGYAVLMFGTEEAHLLNLTIAEPHQGRGHGKRLLAMLLERIAARGVRTMLLEVRPSNAVARRMYRGFGFEEVGLRHGYYPATEGREDAIVLRLES